MNIFGLRARLSILALKILKYFLPLGKQLLCPVPNPHILPLSSFYEEFCPLPASGFSTSPQISNQMVYARHRNVLLAHIPAHIPHVLVSVWCWLLNEFNSIPSYM